MVIPRFEKNIAIGKFDSVEGKKYQKAAKACRLTIADKRRV